MLHHLNFFLLLYYDISNRTLIWIQKVFLADFIFKMTFSLMKISNFEEKKRLPFSAITFFLNQYAIFSRSVKPLQQKPASFVRGVFFRESWLFELVFDYYFHSQMAHLFRMS